MDNSKLIYILVLFRSTNLA